MTDAAGRPASGTITHRDILRGLTTSQKRHLTMRSNAMGLRQLALHLGLIVVLVAHPRLLLFEFDLLPVLVGEPFAQNLRCIIWDLCGPLARYVF